MSAVGTRGAWRVPGRIEFLGKHTDYAGGNVLVGAVDRGVSAVAEQVDGAAGFLSATTTAGGEPVSLQAGMDHGLAAGHWGRYLQTVLDRLTANFGPSVPAHLTITSDLPPASGMSSSSALICASALALADLNGWSSTELWRRNIPDRLSLAGYLAGVEAGRPWRELLGAEGVGTQGGSEDHTGMLCGEADTLLLARFAPMEIRERVAFPEDWAIVVGVSGVLAEKTGAALANYNRGPLTLRSVLARWNKSTGRQDA
ncbi:MAG: Galactokinase, partial [Actinomyces urogenitalis DORA_12]